MECLFLFGHLDGQLRDVRGHGFPPEIIATSNVMYERVEFVEDGESFFFYRAAGETGSLMERMIELTQETE